MKLAEALLNRKQMQDQLIELEQRIKKNVIVQEGDLPFEDAIALINQSNKIQDELNSLIKRINNTNVNTSFGQISLAEALVNRDTLMSKRNTLNNVIEQASERVNRYSASEIKIVTVVDIKALIKERDQLSQKIRKLDAEIQQLNWLTDLI